MWSGPSPSGTAQSGTRGRLPVATTTASAPALPPGPRAPHATVCGPTKRASPLTVRTPSEASNRSTEACSREADLAYPVAEGLVVHLARRGIAGEPKAPHAPEKLSAPAVAIIALEGMQSQRFAAPPTMSRSTSVTWAPRLAARAGDLVTGRAPRLRRRGHVGIARVLPCLRLCLRRRLTVAGVAGSATSSASAT